MSRVRPRLRRCGGRPTSPSRSCSRSPARSCRTGSSPATRTARSSSRWSSRTTTPSPCRSDELIPPGGSLAPGDEWRPVDARGRVPRRGAGSRAQPPAWRNRRLRGARAVPPGRTVGCCSIDRGWVPPGEDQPLPDAFPAPPEGEVDRDRASARRRAAARLGTLGAGGPGAHHQPTARRRRSSTPRSLTSELSAYGVLVSEDPGARDACRRR